MECDTKSYSEKVYDFQIVEFISRGPKNKRRQTDIVPLLWITYDKKRGHYLTKFMPPPYTEDKSNFFHHLVKTKSPPLEEWSDYHVDFVGEGKTYEEAKQKLDKLKNDCKTIYTTDSEFGSGQKAEYIKRQVREVAKDSGSQNLQLPESLDHLTSSSDSSFSIQNEIKDLVSRKKIRTHKTKTKKSKNEKSTTRKSKIKKNELKPKKVLTTSALSPDKKKSIGSKTVLKTSNRNTKDEPNNDLIRNGARTEKPIITEIEKVKINMFDELLKKTII